MTISLRPREHIHSRKTDRINNMELLHATYVTHEFTPHFHESFAVGVIERGEYSYRYRGSTRYIGKGQIVIINPGEVHTGRAMTDEGWTYRMFYPEVSFMQSLAGDIYPGRESEVAFSDTVVDDREVASRLLAAHTACLQGNSPVYDTAVMEAFGELIVRYGGRTNHRQNAQRVTANTVIRALEYMHESYRESPSLQVLSDISGLSLYHFIRVFRNQTGLTPHAYLMNLRTRAARDRLREGTSIAETAIAAGFTDQSHMNRWFKRILGFTPGEYIRGLDR